MRSAVRANLPSSTGGNEDREVQLNLSEELGINGVNGLFASVGISVVRGRERDS